MMLSRLWQKAAYRKVLPTLKHLAETQYWAYERIRTYQLQGIRRLLEHAYRHVPYYRTLLDGIGARPEDIRSFDDFRSIPVLTKEAVRQHREALQAANVPQGERVPNATGGSTGEPLAFLQDRGYEIWADAARIRGWYQVPGCDMGARCAVLWGAVRDIREDFSVLERLRMFLFSGEIPMNAFNLSRARKREFLRWCRLLGPELLRGYVTAIHDLALFLEDQGLSFPPVKGVILCAETVEEEVRARIEQAFRAPAYNMYGGRELSLIAMECAEKQGLHEVSENNYVEFEEISLSGHASAGELVITNLHNYAMPFIRYKIGDIGVPGSPERCACGRGLPRLAKVLGRTTEVFVFGDGTRVAGELFIHLMKDFPLRRYQFVQTSHNRIVLRVPRDQHLDPALKERIRETYGRHLPEEARIDFEEVGDLEKSGTGKFRFVFREMP